MKILKQLNFDDFKRLMSLIKPRRLKYSVGILGSCIIDASVSIFMAFILKDLMGAALNRDSRLLIRALVTIGGITGGLCIFAPVLEYMYCSSIKRTMADIRLKLFDHAAGMKIRYYEKNHSGDMISRMTNDVQTMEQAYGSQLRMVVFTVLFGLGCAVIMMIMDWRIGLVLVLFGLLSAFVNSRFAVPIRRISDKIQKNSGELTERLTDLLAGFNVTKMYKIKDIIMGRYSEMNNITVSSSMARTRVNSYLDSVNFLLIWLNFGGVMGFGSLMVINGSIGYDKLVAIVQLLNGVVFMFVQLGNFISQLQGSLAGAGRVFELLDEPSEPERYNAGGDADSNGIVEFTNVSFAYEEGNKVLDGLALCVGKGQTAALVGPSGGGKSTVIKLLLGYYPPDSGNIVINGKPMGQYTLEELRNMMAYVPQDAYLFDGTIEENIRYGRPDATKEKVIEAARMANAHDFIMEQPDGYDTVVGERGARLSGGQKQRIAIARALLKDAPILLLDEATSALDSESEQLVQEALNILMEGRTTIAVAHRLSTIEHADIIYVINEGKVGEQGKHQELSLREGLYRELYELQFKQNETSVEGCA